MRAAPSLPDAALLLLGVGAAVIAGRAALRLLPDIWVVTNALLQPAR